MRFAWLDCPGLSAADLFERREQMPNLCALIRRASLGTCHLEGPAIEELALASVGQSVRVASLEFAPDGSLVRDAALSYGAGIRAQLGEGVLWRELLHTPEDVTGGLQRGIRDALTQARRSGATRLVLRLHDAVRVVMGSDAEARRAFDRALGEVLLWVGCGSVMLSSPTAVRRFRLRVGMQPLLRAIQGALHSASLSGSSLMLIVDTVSLASIVHLMESAEVDGIALFSSVTHALHGDRSVVVARAAGGLGLSDDAGDAAWDLDGGGVLLVAGPHVRRGVYLHVAADELLALAGALAEEDVHDARARVPQGLGHLLGEDLGLGYFDEITAPASSLARTAAHAGSRAA